VSSDISFNNFAPMCVRFDASMQVTLVFVMVASLHMRGAVVLLSL